MQRFNYIFFMFLLCSMNTLYAQNNIRQKTSINSYWKFHKGDYENVIYKDFDDSQWETVNIPHTWNAKDIFDDEPGYYRGVSWYRKTFRVNPENEGKRIWLYFEGANQDASVFVNGKHIGNHHGGYTAFSMDITDHVKFNKSNLLAVKLNNDWNPDIPPLGGDLCHFGGIYRDVFIVSVDPVHFDLDFYASSGILIDAPEISKTNATVRIRSKIKNDDIQKRNLIVEHRVLDPAGRMVNSTQTKVSLKTDEDKWIDMNTDKISDPILWSPDNPALYKLNSVIKDAASNKVLDRVSNTFGLRWVSVDADEGFFLNGNPLFIKGIGRHQDYKDIGYAIPDEINYLDVKLFKEMGGNLMRGHYPFDPVVYETGDKLGVMMLPRLPVMDVINHSEAFTEGCKHMLKEMIYQHFNHPSIVIWEYSNEVFGEMDWYWEKPQDPEKVEKNMKATYEWSVELEEFVRELDPSRLTEVVFHTDPTPEWYKEAGLTDICHINGWNLYQGWYHNNLDSVAWAMDHFREYSPEAGYVVAEYGAGSDPRIHSYNPTIFDFSTEYQEKFHKVYLDEAAKRPWIGGLFIWTLVDFQVKGRQDAVPHINSKGLLTVDRKPKDVYFLHQAQWSSKPMVHISSEHWTKRIEMVSGQQENIEREIIVYTNQDEAELFQNGKSLGKQKVNNCIARWTVPFINGSNQMEAQVIAGDITIKDHKDIEVSFLYDNIQKFGFPGNNLCINVGQSRTFLTDEVTRNYWLHGQEYKKNSFGHKNGRYYTIWRDMKAWQGIREGIDKNIKGTNIDPIFQTFLVNIQDYQLDVPDGAYEVALYFTEPFAEKRRLEPKEKTGADKNGDRVFNVRVNDIKYINELDLASQYGVTTAAIKTVFIEASGGEGIHIKLEPVKGEPVLSGIKIIKK